MKFLKGKKESSQAIANMIARAVKVRFKLSMLKAQVNENHMSRKAAIHLGASTLEDQEARARMVEVTIEQIGDVTVKKGFAPLSEA